FRSRLDLIAGGGVSMEWDSAAGRQPQKRVGRGTSGRDYHRSIVLLCLIVEDILELIGCEQRPVSLCDDHRTLDHHRPIARRSGCSVKASAINTASMLHRRELTSSYNISSHHSMADRDPQPLNLIACGMGGHSRSKLKSGLPSVQQLRTAPTQERAHLSELWVAVK